MRPEKKREELFNPKKERDKFKQEGRTFSQNDIAGLFDISLDVLREYSREGLPRTKSGRKFMHKPAEVHHWIVDYKLKKLKAQLEVDKDLKGGEGESEEAKSALDKYRKIKAEQAEFELNVKKGEYVQKDKMVSTIKGFASHIVKGFADLPKAIAMDITGRETTLEREKIIREYIEDVLEVLADGNQPEFEN